VSATGADHLSPPPAGLPRRRRLDALRLARLRRRPGLAVGTGVRIGRGVEFDLGPGSRVVLGDGCAIGDGARILVRWGTIAIGPGAVLGERCTLLSHASITVGAGAVLGDGAFAVDFDHGTADVEAPIRLQPLETTPVTVGEGARIGHGANLLRGVRIGEGAVVGAHAVVTRSVPARATVGGVPARPAPAPGSAAPAAPAPAPARAERVEQALEGEELEEA
jgi:acetyltransferase-like isoleucine patch superfamily enzyme